jgi:hypothetical protein
MRLLSVSHNTFNTKSFPWAQRVTSGLTSGPACDMCGVKQLVATSDIDVMLEPRKGSVWPDVLGCGAYPFFIVSRRVIEAWEEDRIGAYPNHHVKVLPPIPDQLRAQPSPEYFWLDGAGMRGASLDFAASGFVGVRFCPQCGNRTEDIGATYERRRSKVWPYQFVPGSWGGAKLFTADLSPTKFFCTDDVLQSAARRGLTNFRFLRTEEGQAPSSEGIKYLPEKLGRRQV